MVEDPLKDQKRGQGRSLFEYHNHTEDEEEEYEEEVGDDVQTFINEEEVHIKPVAPVPQKEDKVEVATTLKKETDTTVAA